MVVQSVSPEKHRRRVLLAGAGNSVVVPCLCVADSGPRLSVRVRKKNNENFYFLNL